MSSGVTLFGMECNVQWQKMGLLISGSEVIYITPHTNAFIKI